MSNEMLVTASHDAGRRVAGREVQLLVHRREEVGDVAVLDHHALRAAGRARREDDVGEVGCSSSVGHRRRDRCGGRRTCRARSPSRHAVAPSRRSREWVSTTSAWESSSIIADAHRRVAGSIGTYAAAGLEDPEQADHHLDRALDEHARPSSRARRRARAGGRRRRWPARRARGTSACWARKTSAMASGVRSTCASNSWWTHAVGRVRRAPCRVPRLHRRQPRPPARAAARRRGSSGVIDDRRQHVGEQLAAPGRMAVGVEPAAVVGQLEVDLRVEVGEQRQREVRLVVEVEVARLERAARAPSGGCPGAAR